MSFIRAVQGDEEILLNTEYITKIQKGKTKYEFIITIYFEAHSTIYEIFGDGGRKCEKLLAVKNLIKTGK
jgi:hypothetical protein